jgi:hypothetical protein
MSAPFTPFTPAARKHLDNAEKVLQVLRLRCTDPELVPRAFDGYSDEQLSAFLASSAVELHHELAYQQRVGRMSAGVRSAAANPARKGTVRR